MPESNIALCISLRFAQTINFILQNFQISIQAFFKFSINYSFLAANRINLKKKRETVTIEVWLV